MEKAHRFSWRATAWFLSLSILVIGCATAKRMESEENQKQKLAHLAQLEELKVKRDVTLRKIHQESLPKLIDMLEEDAKAGREPFNSLAFRELTKQRRDQGAALYQEINRRKQVSYITLLALRKIDRQSYQNLPMGLRLNTLLSELGRSKFYNKWGIPHLYWEDAAKALIELGRVAEPGLRQFLRDKSPAPVWGSEEVQEYEAYQYRRCDYALGMILAIRGEKLRDLPRSPGKRDQRIEQLLGGQADRT